MEALKMSELAELSKMGHYSESPEALCWMSNITRASISMTYGAKLVGDALNMDISHENRIKPKFNEKIWQAIKSGHFPGVIMQKKTSSGPL